MEAPAPIPTHIGRYEVVERLAAGGMGEVFVGRMAGPGGFIKPIAIKRIHPHLAQAESFIHMLHDEAKVTASIRHPNIVATLDLGFDGHNHFVVLDYVSGESISRVIRQCKREGAYVPPWLVAWVGAETASALHAAHEARSLSGEPLEIIHRDISPGNVMLSDDGHVMLFDFGVAKARQRLHETTAGELKGKLAYMPPETFRGVSVSRTNDIFALGVVLYEMLAGSNPFAKGSDVETITAVATGHVPPLRSVRPDVPPGLEQIIMAAMAPAKESRYLTAADLERDLRAWARHENQPHDASSVASWLSGVMASRLMLRRALLARVAHPTSTPPFGTPGGFASALGPHSSSGISHAGLAQTQTPPPTHAGMAFTPPPAPSAISEVSPLPALDATRAPPPRRSQLVPAIIAAVLASAVGVGAVVLLLPAKKSAPAAESAETAAAAAPSARESATATASAEATASAPASSASSEPPVADGGSEPSGKVVAAKRPAGKGAPTPAPTATTKPTGGKGGLIRRDYD